jgi:Tfp pilus assembly protein PilO
MKSFFAQLRPMERRLAVAVLVVIVLVLNWWFIWPHFYDWSNLHRQLTDGQQKLALYQKTIDGASKYDAMVKTFESQGGFVPGEDQAIDFLRTLQSQSTASGAGLVGIGRLVTHTNEFFVEQMQSIDVTGNDQQLVDFLYKLGSTASMIRVLDLELQPDQSKMRLNAHVQLVASYQKNLTMPGTPNKKPTVKISKSVTAAGPGIRPQFLNPHPNQP